MLDRIPYTSSFSCVFCALMRLNYFGSGCVEDCHTGWQNQWDELPFVLP
jgi:hypothetical protein